MTTLDNEVSGFSRGVMQWHIFSEFKEFINRGNVLDLGVGIIIGGAFSGVVNSFVNDILTPPLGLLVSGSNLENWFYIIKEGHTPNATYSTPQEAQADGAVTENVGHFLVQILNFFLVGITLFFIVTGANAFRKERDRLAQNKADAAAATAPATQTCNWCKENIPKTAVRCQYCTSYVNEKVPDALKTPEQANSNLINLDGSTQ